MIETGNVSGNEPSHFTVDWDGPDDPGNPKKSGLPTEYDARLNHPLQLDVPQKMGRDCAGIRLHFPEPRLIRHDRTSRA